jgi:predicted HicB family RNase H-like nuclease
MDLAGKSPQKDYGKPRCLARLTDDEHAKILLAAKKSGLSVKRWLMSKIDESKTSCSRASSKPSRCR